MWSLTLTDIIQFVIMTVGIFGLLLPFAISEAGGWNAMWDALPASYASITGIGWNAIFTYFLLFFFGLMIGQDIWQRVFTGRDEKVIRRGTIFAGVYCIFYGIAGALIGAAAKVVVPRLVRPTRPSRRSRRRRCRSASRGSCWRRRWRRSCRRRRRRCSRPRRSRPPTCCARAGCADGDADRDARARRRGRRRLAGDQRCRRGVDRGLRLPDRGAVRADRARAAVAAGDVTGGGGLDGGLRRVLLAPFSRGLYSNAPIIWGLVSSLVVFVGVSLLPERSEATGRAPRLTT